MEAHPREASRTLELRGIDQRSARETHAVLKGNQEEMKAVRLFTKTHLGSKCLVVVYLEKSGKKDIITAYFTSDFKRVKGELIWKA